MPVGSGWSLTVIIQPDIEADASQNSSGHQSIGRIANSHNTTTRDTTSNCGNTTTINSNNITARDTTSNCGNTTTTNSNNTTTNNSRTYKESNHNELLHTKINGHVRIGSPTCSVLRRGNTWADTQRLCLENTTIYNTPQPSPAVNTQTREDLEKFGRLEGAVT